MTHKDISRFTDAWAEIATCINEAENVFALLARIQQSGEFDGFFGIVDMAAVAAGAFGRTRRQRIRRPRPTAPPADERRICMASGQALAGFGLRQLAFGFKGDTKPTVPPRARR